MTRKYNGIVIRDYLHGRKIDLYYNEGDFNERNSELSSRVGMHHSKWVKKPKTASKLIKMINKEINDTWAGNN